MKAGQLRFWSSYGIRHTILLDGPAWTRGITFAAAMTPSPQAPSGQRAPTSATIMAVALIGSSGGGAATLGHTEPTQLLQTINDELAKIQGDWCLTHALFVSLHGGRGLDSANPTESTATLHAIDCNETEDKTNKSGASVRVVQSDILAEVNKTCFQMDASIAEAILGGEVKGLICVSCDPGIHSKTLEAASVMRIPVTGSGGTSLSIAVTRFDIQLVGNSGGSVATNSYTRAISFAHALATAWKMPYHPFSSSDKFVTPQWRSVLNATLPAFWAVCLACQFLNLVLAKLVSNDSDLNMNAWTEPTRQLLTALQSYALPTACCVVMATSCASRHGSTAVMASCTAAMACRQSILAGLLAGWLVSLVVGRVVYRCVVWNIPATMTNLAAAGGTGAAVAIVVAPLVPALQGITTWIRLAVHVTMSGRIPGAGFVIGCLFCFGSKIGYYHALCLPVILIEMELGQASVWGAIDECTLVLVSAGICSANLMMSSSLKETDVSLCKRAVRINLLYGDFIEAAYPFMEESRLVNAAGYLASGISTEFLARNPRDILSLAYLPLPVSILLANDWHRMALASFIAFGVSFAGTAINNVLFDRSKKTKQPKQD